MHVYGVWAYVHMHAQVFVCTRVCVVLRQEHPITFPETRDSLGGEGSCLASQPWNLRATGPLRARRLRHPCAHRSPAGFLTCRSGSGRSGMGPWILRFPRACQEMLLLLLLLVQGPHHRTEPPAASRTPASSAGFQTAVSVIRVNHVHYYLLFSFR